MKLNVSAFAIGETVAAVIVFSVCSFFISFLPASATSLAGYALHVNLSGIIQPMTFGGFIIGLLVISIGWGFLSLVAAVVYNSVAQKAD